MLGIVGRPSGNLNLFSEFRVDPANKTEMEVGFRTRFPEWSVTGSLSSKGKAFSLYKRTFEILECTWQGTVDFADPKKPASFGVGLAFGMGGGM